ncbi:MAG: hypothetical protein GF383_14960 [Candidatus Lokiarchaeota archaeon]|nr:hypothetical protein [Candidatus Lokiarchaeota archaeon]MBD3342775.1 hypothetical protein [Candidatus Lokiarchaeota archaeon]
MNGGKIPEGAMPSQILDKIALTKLANMNSAELNEMILQEGTFGYNNHFAKEIYRCKVSGLGRKDCEAELDIKTGDILFFNNPSEYIPSKNIEDKEQIRKKLKKKVDAWFVPPEDAEFDGIYADPEMNTGNNMFEIRWKRKNWIGDYISIIINPVSMKIWNFAMKWHDE